MYKGLFLSLPSVSVTRVLTPVANRLAEGGYKILYYNTEKFIQPFGNKVELRAYPAYENGYHPGCIDAATSYLQFSEILIDTGAQLMNFLIQEVEREKPDFILHSHLAVWGKLLALRFKLPAVSLFSTFILDQRFMKPLFRSMSAGKRQEPTNASPGLDFFRKARRIYDGLGLEQSPDVWDTYVNREELNVLFVDEVFQPHRELFGPDCQYAGFPLRLPPINEHRQTIYVAMGSMLNNDTELYLQCIRALNGSPFKVILSIGDKIDPAAFGTLPDNVQLVRFTDQIKMLNESVLFITKGGMASVQEAIHCSTPMIVLPSTPEQRLTAEKIVGLGIGLQLDPENLSEAGLGAVIQRMLDERTTFVSNIQNLLDRISNRQDAPPAQLAYQWIDNYLEHAVRKASLNHDRI